MAVDNLNQAETKLYSTEHEVRLCATLTELRNIPTADNATWCKNTTALSVLYGSSSAFDGTYGLFAWNSASSAGDNGTSIIKPTAVSGNGRWIKLL